MPFTSGFDPAFLGDHFRRHGADFGATTAQEYESLADAFLGGPLGADTLECEKVSNGDKLRYDLVTQEFGLLSRHQVIRTYFKPNPTIHRYPTNLAYFDAECQK